MAKTRKNKKNKSKSKTAKKYDKLGDVNFISHKKYMAVRLVDKEIKASKVIKKKLSRKKKDLLPYINEEYKKRIIKLLKKKKLLTLLRKKEKKRIPAKNVTRYVNKLSPQKAEELYLYLLALEKPKKNIIS